MADDEVYNVEELEAESKTLAAKMEELQRQFQEMKDACQTMQKDMKESDSQLKKHHALIKDLD